MLTESQRNGIQDLLSRLDEDVVYSIADTTTKKALAFTTLRDAVDAILLHSESALWLLNRKKLTRNILFEYLNAKKVSIPGQAEKSTIIERVLELWEQGGNQDVASSQPNVVTSSTASLQEFSPVGENPEMGLKFAQWFYGILLTIYNQSCTELKLADQFWADATLQVTFSTAGSIDQHKAIGSEEAGSLLHRVLSHHGLLLNPNLSVEGVREKKSPHGFVIIGVCGTVHQQANCSGIFEQVFGLLQDPSAEFRWRIKWTEVRITQAIVNKIPCVNDLPELLALCDNLQ